MYVLRALVTVELCSEANTCLQTLNSIQPIEGLSITEMELLRIHPQSSVMLFVKDDAVNKSVCVVCDGTERCRLFLPTETNKTPRMLMSTCSQKREDQYFVLLNKIGMRIPACKLPFTFLARVLIILASRGKKLLGLAEFSKRYSS